MERVRQGRKERVKEGRKEGRREGGNEVNISPLVRKLCVLLCTVEEKMERIPFLSRKITLQKK